MINTSPFVPNIKGHWEIDEETGEEIFIKEKIDYPTTIKTYEAIMKNGQTEVKETGEIDFQAEIESHRNEVELSELVRRFIAGATDTGIGEEINYGSEKTEDYDLPEDINGLMQLARNTQEKIKYLKEKTKEEEKKENKNEKTE